MYTRTIMMGRLVQDPELRKTGNDISVATFSIAVDRPYLVNGNRKADFFNCVAWRNTGEFISKYFRKGKVIHIEGHFENRSYDDKAGNKRYVTELIVEHVTFAGDSSGKGEKAPFPDAPPEPHGGQASGDFSELDAPPAASDDLPF